jgi:hypothetical protein
MQGRSGNGSKKRKCRIADIVRRASAITVEPLENRWMLNGIGFNFTGGSAAQGSNAYSMLPGDMAGPFDTGGASGPLFAGNSNYVQGNWNNNAGANGRSTTIIDSTGATIAGASITWSSAGTWASVTNPPDGGYEIINTGFLNSGGTGTPVVITINNIPYSQYEVYVYELNDVAGHVSTTSAYGVSYVGTSPDPHSSIPGPSGNQFWIDGDHTTPYAYILASSRDPSNATPNADLVRFQMQGGSQFQVLEVAPGNGYVNAIQIVDTSSDHTTTPETPVLSGQNSVGAAILTWNSAAAGAGSQALAGGYTFIIERGFARGTETPYTTLSASPGLTTFFDTAAIAQTTYYYKIIAQSPNGTNSVLSNEVVAINDVNTPPGPVSNLSATLDNQNAPTAVILNWTAPLSSTTNYTIYRSTTGPSGPFNAYATTPYTTTFTDSGVSGGNSYLYEVLPDNNGNSFPFAGSGKVPPPATAAQPPSGSMSSFVGQGIGNDTVTNPGTLLYTGSGEGLSGYYFNNVNDATWRVTSNFQPSRTPTFTPVYCQIDPTINQTGTANVAPVGAPITWNSNGGVGVSFAVEWLGFIQPFTNGVYTFFPRSDDGEALFIQNINTGQYIQLTDNFNASRAPIDSVTTPFPLIAGQLYGIEVLFRQQGGAWDAELRWAGPGVSKQLLNSSQLYPVAPLATTLTAQSNDQVVSLTWPSMACDQVVLWRGTSAGTMTHLVTLKPNASSFLDTSINNGTTYFYKVSGQLLYNNAVTTSTDSNTVLAVPSLAPMATTSFSLVRTDWNRVSLNWNAVPFAQQYHVMRSTNSNGSSATELSTVTYSNTLAPFQSLSFNDSTATMGTTYFYFVVAQYNDPFAAIPLTSTSAIQTADMGHGVEAHYYQDQFWKSNSQNDNGNTSSPLSEQLSGVALSWDNFNGQRFGGVTNNTQANGLGSLGFKQVDQQGFLQNLDKNYNSGSPTAGINSTSWSAVYTGKITVNTAGIYTFVTNSNDDSWVYVDGQLVVNDPNGHDGRDTFGTLNGNIGKPISLNAGNHSVVVFYSQGNGGDVMRLRYTVNGIGIGPISTFNTTATVYWNQFALDKPATIDNAPTPLHDPLSGNFADGIAGQEGQTPTVFMTFNYSTTVASGGAGVDPAVQDNAVDFLVERSDVTSGFTPEWLQIGTVGLGSTAQPGGPVTGVGSIVTFSDATALPGHSYQYRVRAVNFDQIGDPGPVSDTIALPTAATTFGQSMPGATTGALEAHWYNDQFWGSTVSRGQSTNSKNVITQWGLGGYMNGQATNTSAVGEVNINGNLSPTLGQYSTFDQVHNVNFSVAFTGRIHITESGTYSFMSNTDDDGYIWISNGTNQVLVDQDGGGHTIRNASDSPTNITPIVLSAGQNYDFLFVESQGGNAWGMNLFWRTPSDDNFTPYHLITSSQSDAFNQPSTEGFFSTASPVIAPADLTVGAISNNNRTTLTWADNNQSEIRYVIERATDSGFTTNVTEFQAGMNSGSYIDFVPPNGTYFYRIRAENFDYASAWTSGSQSIVSANAMPTLTGLSVTQVGSEIHLSWTNQNNQNNITSQSSSASPGTEAGTVIQRSIDDGGFANYFTTQTNINTFTDQAIVPGHTYKYQVFTAPTTELRPVDAGGVITMTNLAIPAGAPFGTAWITYADASGNIDRTAGFTAGDAGGLFRVLAAGSNLTNPSITADGRLRLTDNQGNEARAAWVNVGTGFLGGKNAYGGQWDSEFDFTFNSGTADGMTFMLERSNNGQLGGSAGSLGVQNISTGNIGVYFNLWNNVTETGLFLNNARKSPSILGGGPSNTNGQSNPSGTFGNAFHSNDTFHASISYDGIGNIHYTLTDTNTSKTFSTVYALDPTQVILDQNTFAGFTAGTGSVSATMDVMNWWFSPSGQTPPTTIKGTSGTDNVYIRASAPNSQTINYWTSASAFTPGTVPTTAPTGTYSLSSTGVKFHGLGVTSAATPDVLTIDESNGPVFVSNKTYRVNEFGTAGTFTISVTTAAGTQTTSALAFNASAAAVQIAVGGLSNVGANGVRVFQDAAGPAGFSGSPYTLTFSNAVAAGITTVGMTGSGGSTGNVTTPGGVQASFADSVGSTANALSVNIVGTTGADTFVSDQPNSRYTFKNGANVDGVQMGNLTALQYIDNGPPDTAGDTITTNAGAVPVTITATANDTITVTSGSTTNINVSGGSTESITVNSGGTANITNTGNNTFTVANAGTMAFNGGPGDDTFTINCGPTGGLPSGGFSVDGGAGNNSLVLLGGAQDENVAISGVTASSGSVAVNAGSLNYVNVANITFTDGGGNNNITISGPVTVTLNLGAGGTSSTNDVGAASAADGAIGGVVFDDANGNGKRDAAEKGIAGRTVWLDYNHNGKLDPGEPTMASGADGAYHFSGLAPGSYRVHEMLPTGWRTTTPAGGFRVVTVVGGQTHAAQNFGQTQLGLISGVVFNDINHNGKQDAGEKGIAGMVAYIDANNNGRLDKFEISVLTDSTGHYHLAAPAGKYHLRIVPKRSAAHMTPLSRVVSLVAGKIASGEDFAVN